MGMGMGTWQWTCVYDQLLHRWPVHYLAAARTKTAVWSKRDGEWLYLVRHLAWGRGWGRCR